LASVPETRFRSGDHLSFYLDRCSLFAGLPRDQRSELARRAQELRLERRQPFFREGEAGGAWFVLCTGSVKISRTSASGEAVILDIVGTGGAFGSVGLAAGAAYPVTAVALESCHALSWGPDQVQDVIARTPVLVRNMLSLLSRQTIDLEERYLELATEKVAQRVVRTLERLAARHGTTDPVDIPLSREMLARMTGTTLFTVSRLLSGWESTGIVAGRREGLVVQDRRRLELLS
jgi:CRP-like cAMP-binding protein